MKLQAILDHVKPVLGETTMIAAICGDAAAADAVKQMQTPLEITRASMRVRLADVRAKQTTCGSDAAWWALEGRIAFLQCLLDCLEAAKITGMDTLPDVPLPDLQSGVVMDIYGRLSSFGADILALAMKQGGTPVFAAGSDVKTGAPVPPGMRRDMVPMTNDDIERITVPLFAVINDLHDNQGESGLKIFGALLYLAGTVAAFEGVLLDEKLPLGEALPIVFEGMKDARTAKQEVDGERRANAH